MDTAQVKKITNELSIAGQITTQELQQLAQDGFRAVVNLRSPSESGFLETEQQQAETLGLQYLNLPMPCQISSNDTILPILQQIDGLAKPVLIHCNSALRATAIALIHIATHQGISLDKALQQAQQLGLLGSTVNYPGPEPATQAG